MLLTQKILLHLAHGVAGQLCNYKALLSLPCVPSFVRQRTQDYRLSEIFPAASFEAAAASRPLSQQHLPLGRRKASLSAVNACSTHCGCR